MRHGRVDGAVRTTRHRPVAVLVACLCLAATDCGENGRPAGARQERPGPPGGEPDGVVLRYMIWGKENEVRELRAALDGFERANPDVSVELIHVTGFYQVKLTTMLAGGVAPDVFMVHAAMFPALAERELLLPLDEFVARDPDVDLGAFFPEVVRACRYRTARTEELVLYQLPVSFGTTLVFYNKDLFDAAGVPYPEDDWTWEDFLEKAKRLTVRDEKGRALRFGSLNVGRWLTPFMFMWQNGGEVFDEEGGLVIGKNEFLEKNAEALRYCADLEVTHRVQPTASVTESLPSNPFEAGRVAMFMTGTWHLNQMRGFEGFRWDLAPPPRRRRRATLHFGGSPVICRRTEHPEEAWRLLKFFVSDEWQRYTTENARGTAAKIAIEKEYGRRIPGIPAEVRLELVSGVLPWARPIPLGIEISEIMEQRIAPLVEKVMMGDADAREEMQALQREADLACPYCSTMR